MDSFLQVLVPGHVLEAMERGEVEVLGDSTARGYRGCDVLGRQGGDLVWGREVGFLGEGEAIEGGFVVRALGDCVRSEVREREVGR